MTLSLRGAGLALLCMLAAPIALLAQTGTLTGRVTDAETGAPLVSATVRVVSEQTTRQTGAITDAAGRYAIRGLAPGRYSVSMSFVGFSTFESQLELAQGEQATLDAALAPGTLSFGEIVVSASRSPEKVTEAPASVSVVNAQQIEQRPALTVVEHIKEIPGVDMVQTGLTQSNVVVRGFNNLFSGTLMTLVDNRVASVPSLRLNAYNFIPIVNEDIQQIEVIRGPGAALYGPNTANGVMHTITRSPFSSAGTWLSATVGERDLLQGMFRHAGSPADWLGYKISGQYMRGTDWGGPDVDTAESGARRDADTNDPYYSRIGIRDSSIERFGGEVRLDIIPFEDMTAIVAVGLNQALRNTDMTGLGAAQVDDWRYTYYQLRLLYKDLFVQGFINQSDAGQSYLLRTGQPVVDRSMLYVAQAQHSARPIDELSLTYGADVIVTNPVTDSTITGRNEGDDDAFEIGGYVQSQASLVDDLLELVVALRADHHSRLDDLVFSPRAALVATPLENHTLRLTYNRAYSTPTTNELFMDILGNRSQLFDVRGSGVQPGGFTFRFENGRHFMHVNSFAGPSGERSGRDLPIGGDTVLWNLVRQAVKSSTDTSELGRQLKLYADFIPAPPDSVVGVEMRLLSYDNGTFEPYDPPNGRIPDRPSMRPTITQTLEIGYNGMIADRVAIAVDLYRSHYTDFVGPLEVITPSVFYRRDELARYLESIFLQGGLPEADAKLYAELAATKVGGIAGSKDELGIPLATVTPEEASDTAAVMLTYRNYGEVTLYGADISIQAAITERIGVSGSLSYVDRNYFENLDGVADLSLNAPKLKFSIGAEYDDPALGFNSSVRVRHVDGFRVRSGVYFGDVKGYTVVDAGVGYRLPWIEGSMLSISAQNLLTFVDGAEGGPFEQRHYEFVGVPAIGRLVMARLTYSFK